MLNKRILASAMSILTALSMMGGATFAYFSDTAASNNNTFTSGNADLQIAEDVQGDEVFSDAITGPNFSGIFPGQTKTFNFWLKNNSLSAINLDLLADISAISPAGDDSQQIDNVLLISWVCDIDGDGDISDETPTAEYSPRTWLDGGNANLGTLVPGEQMICRMSGRLPIEADSTVAGQTVVFNAAYNATQAL